MTQDIHGFMYRGQGEHDGTVCQIVGQESNSDILLDIGPIFFVRWGSGEVEPIPACLLSPWFPV